MPLPINRHYSYATVVSRRVRRGTILWYCFSHTRHQAGNKFTNCFYGCPQMLKAHVLTLLPPSLATYEEALGICREIARRKTPPVEDVDVVMFLQRVWAFLEDAGAGEKGEGSRECVKVWEGAVKARPGDEKMAREWVFGCVREGDWRGMQKVSWA